MTHHSTATLKVQGVRGGQVTIRDDLVPTEEPMEVRVVCVDQGESRSYSVSVTMRTPGDDFELAAGFLLTEGIIDGRDAIYDINYCTDPELEQEYNIVNVQLGPGVYFGPELLTRNFYSTSSCGVCGKASLEALRLRTRPAKAQQGPKVATGVICMLPDRLKEAQPLFQRTGGVHSSGLFDGEGNLVTLREDVGRHNAMDKLIGHHLLKGSLPLTDYIVMVSGRTSWELMQKALVAGIPMVVAVGAPSSLAVDVAQEFGMSLVGFTRKDSFNIYAGPERVLISSQVVSGAHLLGTT